MRPRNAEATLIQQWRERYADLERRKTGTDVWIGKRVQAKVADGGYRDGTIVEVDDPHCSVRVVVGGTSTWVYNWEWKPTGWGMRDSQT